MRGLHCTRRFPLAKVHDHRRLAGLCLLLGVLVAVLVYLYRSTLPPSEEEIESKYKGFTAQWYQKQLDALKEPSFEDFRRADVPEAVRFVWLRTFHNPVAISVAVSADRSGALVLKVASGKGGYDPGRLETDTSIKLTSDQIDMLRRTIESNKFWERTPPDRAGFDGARWIIEVKRGGQYHFVDEWTPEDGPVRNLGQHLIELSGYVPGEVY